MSHRSEQVLAVTLGLDVGDRFTEVFRLTEEGQSSHERLRTSPEAFEERFAREPVARIVLEAGMHSAWISWLLSGLGHELVVAQPRKLRLITQSVNKTDRHDAEWLARLGRSDLQLVAPIHVRPRSEQADLSLLRARDGLVAVRTALINMVRGLVKPFGAQLPRCSPECFPRKVSELIPEDLAPALHPVLAEIASINGRIGALDQRIAELGETRYPQTALLRQVKYVGPILALKYLLTIDDPHRFRRSRDVGPYLGLTPRRAASGQRDPQLGITKAGDHDLRRLLVLAAHGILARGPDCDLQRWGRAMIERGGKNARKRAVVAVARKLAVLLHRLWVSGEVYEPLRRNEPSTQTLAA
jgi:transposase